MLTTLEHVVASFAFLRRRFRWRGSIDIGGVQEALAEAAALCAERIEDEPAALLLVFIRRPHDLRDAAHDLPRLLAMNVAHQLGYELRLDPTERAFQQLPFHVNARDPAARATFEDVRAFVAERMRPLR